MNELAKENKRLKKLGVGNFTLIFFIIATAAAIYYVIRTIIIPIIDGMPDKPIAKWIITVLILIVVLNIIFWTGIYHVYRYSVQLGIKWRVIGAICGMIPIVHLVVLGIILSITIREHSFEKKKLKLNESRIADGVCNTRYPLLLVHGIFFRDFRYLNYWGRISKELEINGARIFYGQQQSADTVANCGMELAARIKEICEQTGCEKVNVIAHSKGGLDMRYALTVGDTASHVASLTTINTPHRGCEFADYLLGKIGQKQQQAVAKTYNAALKRLGDPNPDFLAGVNDLTAANCAAFNEKIHDVPGVLYQSVGSKMNVARAGRFPLNFSTHLVRYFDGPNDGLVGEKSFPWGENYTFLTVHGTRGISHGDVIDLNRENIPEFDVREYYVQLVANLKNRGF